MKIKHLEGCEVQTYQAPSIEIVSILVEQTILTGSGNVFDGKGPEGYDIDDEVFNW